MSVGTTRRCQYSSRSSMRRLKTTSGDGTSRPLRCSIRYRSCSPDLEKTRPRRNQIVYRVYDVAAQTQDTANPEKPASATSRYGRFWTPVDPEIFGPDNFRVIAGLPDRKTEGDGLATGLLDVISAVVVVGPAAEVRPSQEAAPGPSYRRYPGGLLEYEIVDAGATVVATRFKPLDRSYGGVPAGCEPAPRGCVGETIE